MAMKFQIIQSPSADKLAYRKKHFHPIGYPLLEIDPSGDGNDRDFMTIANGFYPNTEQMRSDIAGLREAILGEVERQTRTKPSHCRP